VAADTPKPVNPPQKRPGVTTAKQSHRAAPLKEAPPIMKRNDTASQFVLTKLLYKVPEAMTVLSLSRSVIYEEIRSGRLRTVTRGRSRLVPANAIADYVKLLEREANDEVAA
jgi:excisionase family DNA binding protein